MCQTFPRVMALGFGSVVATASAGVCPAQLCPFLLKGSHSFLLCFARSHLSAVVRVSSCIGKHILEGREMLLPCHQIIPTGFLFTCCRGRSELYMGKVAEDTLFLLSGIWIMLGAVVRPFEA